MNKSFHQTTTEQDPNNEILTKTYFAHNQIKVWGKECFLRKAIPVSGHEYWVK